jgi:quinol monooxygenase YgiN
MEQKINTKGTVLAFATYKPKPGQDEALMTLVKKHLPILRDLELATENANYIAKALDGTIIEVFEWTSNEAISAAHQHPAVTDIWEKMTLIADFLPMNTLSESQRPFPGFAIVN